MLNETDKNIKFSFYELLDEYAIEIPIIQRDYVQGRDDEQVKDALDGLLADMFNALVAGKDTLDLNFIYGKVEKNLFIPFDGQQRLTTLFLLHLYAFSGSSDVGTLNRFTYTTRQSTKSFLEYLLIFAKDNCFKDISEQLSKIIIDKHWFNYEWLNDPTVDSVLKVMDKIQTKFDKFPEASNLPNLLKMKENCVIRFNFLSESIVDFSEDFYIKLNARGKQLTDFEYFKSEVEEYIKSDKTLIDKFENNIDDKWAIWFWNQNGKEDGFDDRQMAFFHYFLLCKRALRLGSWDDVLREKKTYFRIRDYYKIIDDYGDEIIDGRAITEDIKQLSKVFDTIIAHKDTFYDWSKNGAINSEAAFWEIALFYARCIFCSGNSRDLAENHTKWYRIIRNIIRNTETNANNILNILLSIVSLSKHCDNILVSFANDEVGKLIGMEERIVAEEKRKAKLILSSDDWRDAILQAEEHPYFKGRIAFLLDFSNEQLSDFIKYKNRAGFVFSKNLDDEGIDEFVIPNDGNTNFGIPDESLSRFRCALLSYGEYMLSTPNGTSFLANASSPRRNGWRDLLMDSKSSFVKKLLDDIDITEKMSLNEHLEKITNINVGALHKKWYYWLVDDYRVMEYCTFGLYSYKHWESNTIWLTQARALNSRKSAEYYTFVLRQLLVDKNHEVDYCHDYSTLQKVGIDKIDNVPCQVRFNDNNNCLTLTLVSHDNNEEDEQRTFSIIDLDDTAYRISKIIRDYTYNHTEYSLV